MGPAVNPPPGGQDGPRPDRLGGVAAAARRAGKARPVELWNPPYCGDIGLRIAADGRWYYQDSPILRPALVRLFASVLRKDADGRHYLVTPVEKIGIEVEDAPFLAVDMRVSGRGRDSRIVFRTNVDDEIAAGADHPLRFARQAGSDGVIPYLLVRGRLEARLTRALAHDLIALASEDSGAIGVWSGGTFFPIAAADAIERI